MVVAADVEIVWNEGAVELLVKDPSVEACGVPILCHQL
jgi:hypothetical protein